MSSNARVIATAEKLSEELVSLSVAARIAGVTRQAITQHVSKGHVGPYVQMGANKYITLTDVEKLITYYAMTGRRPKYDEATDRRDDVLKLVGDRARRVVRGLVEQLRRRDAAVEAVKEKYAVKLAAESNGPERRRLRSLRDRQIHAVKREYQVRLDRLHAIREGLLEQP